MSWGILGARRALGLLFLLALTAMVLATAGAAARTPEAAEAEGLVQPLWTPLGLRDGMNTVVVKLADDPVTVVEAEAGRDLREAEKQAIESQLKAKQDALRGSIQQLGGSVLADYQSAYNGIKVRIDRKKAAELTKLPGVVAVRTVQLMEPDNSRGVPLIGTPAVWDGVAGLRGEGVKIAVLDTGIDYTHANFGGPGTTAAFDAADAADTLPASAALFGPAAPRVKGGIDLVGDDYDAGADPGSPALIPKPDPNPLDCNGHGSHVAGTAAGSGVLADGSTYTGPYNASTISSQSWTIGPGVAPKADIYAVRVFGCEGSTDVTVDAIEWAVENEMDVINMSLGSSFGSEDDPSAEASTNAAKAGVIVVASAGNSGPNQYITGSPASGEGAISVAANDPVPTFPGASITTAAGLSVDAINANGYEFTGPLTGAIKVITNNASTAEDESLGCSVAAFGGPLPAGTIAIVNRGVCARVAKAIFGQQAGAAAVVMVNNATTLPPFEGPITSNPDDGTPFTVTIPFLGVRGTSATSDGGRLRATPDGTGATIAAKLLTNTNYTGFADFSSGGPRQGDSGLKPDVTAPGVSITSTLVGSGNGPLTISGTSMAAPHVAGVAALTHQAYPRWSARDIKAAIVNTANPAGVLGYRTSRGGTGLVQPAGSTRTLVVASASNSKFEVALNFGFEELKSDYSEEMTIQLRNNGSSPATFNVASALPSGSPHTVSLDRSSVSVPANGKAEVEVTLSVPAATAGGSNGAGLSFREVAGLIQFTPASTSDNNGVTLRVPYYLVPRALSGIETSVAKLKKGATSATATIENHDGVIAGDADFYAWGLSDRKDRGASPADIRAVGVQSFPFNATNQFIGFSVNTWERWSTPSLSEFDIAVDVDRDGTDDYIVIGVDQGAVSAGSFNGRMGSFVFSTRSAGASINFFAQAPTDSSTANIFILSSQLCRSGEPCLNAANPRFTYSAIGFDLGAEHDAAGSADPVDGTAAFNPWTNAVTTGGFQTVAPGGSATETIAIDRTEWAQTPALGLMIVSLDNASGKDEAQLVKLNVR